LSVRQSGYDAYVFVGKGNFQKFRNGSHGLLRIT
jgi:hypothetical protein